MNVMKSINKPLGITDCIFNRTISMDHSPRCVKNETQTQSTEELFNGHYSYTGVHMKELQRTCSAKW